MKDKTIDRLLGTGKVRESTAKKYITDLERVERIVEKDIDEFTQRDYDYLLSHFAGSKYSNALKRGYIFALKKYYKSFKMKDKLDFIEGMPSNKPKKGKAFLSEEEIDEFLQDIWGYKKKYRSQFEEYRDKFMVVFAYYLNTRRSEIRNAKLVDIKKDKQSVVITDLKGSGEKIEEPVTSMFFWNCLDEYLAVRGIAGKTLFPVSNNKSSELFDKPLANLTITKKFYMFNPVLKSYGYETYNLTPHLMRRTRIAILSKYVSLKDGMYGSRHKTTASYQAYLNLKEREGSKERLSAIMEERDG